MSPAGPVSIVRVSSVARLIAADGAVTTNYARPPAGIRMSVDVSGRPGWAALSDPVGVPSRATTRRG